MRDRYPYSLGPDGLRRFFIFGDDGKEKDVKVSKTDQDRVEKTLENFVYMLEKMEDVKNAPKETALDEEEKLLEWIENTIIPLEASPDTDPVSLKEIEKLKQAMQKEIDAEKLKIAEKRRQEGARHDPDSFDHDLKVKSSGHTEKPDTLESSSKKEKEDNANCARRPIFINGEPLKYKEAPKYDTVSFKEALEKERKDIEDKKIDYKKGTCAFSGTDANKDEKVLFKDSIDGEGKRCYIAYPFGKLNRGKWSENVESIHVNDDTLVIKSRVYLESDIPDFKESLVRVIRTKLPIDSDYSTVTASNDGYFGLCIKVLKKHFEKKGHYEVKID